VIRLRPVGLALLVMLPVSLVAQDVTARLAGRVSPEVRQAVAKIASDAATRGLPVDPLVEKAIEGAAKGVPAVRALEGRLGDASAAVRDAGLTAPDGDVVEGAADALNAGLSASDVRDLVRVSHSPYDPALTLRVAATMAALGVPATQATELVEDAIRAGRSTAELMALPSQVQADIGRGATPEQAAQGLARAAAAGRPAVPPGLEKKGKPANPHRP